MARSTHYNFLNHARKLYQQYLVDEFERKETGNMTWFRLNQKTIHAEKYSQLRDHLSNQDVENSGTVMILPADYPTSDWWYHRKYKNAMSIVRVKGKPTFLLQ